MGRCQFPEYPGEKRSERMLRSILVFLSVLVGCSPMLCGPASAGRLKSPYAEAPRTRVAVAAVGKCAAPPPAVRDLDIVTIYREGDKSWSQADPERAKIREEKVKPLHAYLARIVEFGNKAMMGRGEARSQAQSCLLSWLDSWAGEGALLGTLPQEGQYERKWALVSIGLSYLQAYAGEAEVPLPPQRISQWLRQLASVLPDEYPAGTRFKNNHYYWAGLASVVAGTILDDRNMYAWGLKQYELGVSAVDKDGFLPNELVRRERALAYSAFSTSALVMMAAFARANGEEIVPAHQNALPRLANSVLSGLADPGPFERHAGKQMPWDNARIQASLSWVEIYYAMTGDTAAQPWLRALRPFSTIWLGGNVTGAFGVSVPPGPVAHSAFFPARTATEPASVGAGR